MVKARSAPGNIWRDLRKIEITIGFLLKAYTPMGIVGVDKEVMSIRMLKKKLIAVVRNFVDDATIHGVGRIGKTTNKFTRMIWLVVFLSFCAILLRNAYCLVNKFRSHEYTTSISSEVHPGLNFPAVSICNAHPWSRRRTVEVLKSNFPNVSINEYDALSVYRYFEEIASEITGINMSKAALQLKEMINLQLCEFNGLTCDKIPNIFTVTTSATDGNCFIFNPTGNLMQTRHGVHHGLWLLINIREDELLSQIKPINSNPVGAYITLFNASEYADKQNGAVIASPNYMTKISIKKKKYINLEFPYKDNCTNGHVIKGNLTYTPYLCASMCYMKEMYQRCSALELHIYLDILNEIFGPKRKLATTLQEKACAENFTKDYSDGLINCYCQPLCEEIKFLATASYGTWPLQAEMNIIQDAFSDTSSINMTTEYIRKNIAAVQIYYEDFLVETVEHVGSYSGVSFLSDLGGQLGLMLGASIFSFIEIFIFIFELLSVKFFKDQNIKDPENP